MPTISWRNPLLQTAPASIQQAYQGRLGQGGGKMGEGACMFHGCTSGDTDLTHLCVLTYLVYFKLSNTWRQPLDTRHKDTRHTDQDATQMHQDAQQPSRVKTFTHKHAGTTCLSAGRMCVRMWGSGSCTLATDATRDP